jgi:hypothetical protein
MLLYYKHKDHKTATRFLLVAMTLLLAMAVPA